MWVSGRQITPLLQGWWNIRSCRSGLKIRLVWYMDELDQITWHIPNNASMYNYLLELLFWDEWVFEHAIVVSLVQLTRCCIYVPVSRVPHWNWISVFFVMSHRLMIFSQFIRIIQGKMNENNMDLLKQEVIPRSQLDKCLVVFPFFLPQSTLH